MSDEDDAVKEYELLRAGVLSPAGRYYTREALEQAARLLPGSPVRTLTDESPPFETSTKDVIGIVSCAHVRKDGTLYVTIDKLPGFPEEGRFLLASEGHVRKDADFDTVYEITRVEALDVGPEEDGNESH